jgi:hypothetical protein
MINSKQKGNRIEREVIQQLNEAFEGAKFVSMRGSGAYEPGDVAPQRDPRKPMSPSWAVDWLKAHQLEIKGEKTLRIPAYVEQCKEQFNSVQGWVILLRVPAEWGIPGNLLALQPGLEWLGEQAELMKLKGVKNEG